MNVIKLNVSKIFRMLANTVTDTGSYLEKKKTDKASVHVFTRGLF